LRPRSDILADIADPGLGAAMKFFCLFLFSALALVLEPAGAIADQRMALVMGNSACQRAPRLSNSANDANLLAETFKKAGFTVVDARNDLSAQDMRRALRDFGAKARSADIAVIYYAGHGIEIDGNNYLVPVDAQLENDTDVYDETIGLDRVLVAIEPAKRLRLVILDACRDNPFSKNMKRTMASRAVARGPATTETKSVAAVPASTCTTRTARRGNDAVGGPFIPVSIRPNVEGASVRAIAVSPHAREIATAGDDGVIRLWDASSFRLTRVLKGHSGPVYTLDYWTDGTLLASAGWDGKVRIWDLKSDGQSLTFDAGTKQFAVAFAPEASLKYLASAGEDGVVRIWNVQTRELAKSKLDHQGADPARATVRSLSYAPSGSGEFVSAGFDGKIRFYRTSGTIEAKDAYGRKALHVAYSPDGTRVVTAGSDAELGSAKVWDVKSGTSRLLVGHKDYVVSASWSADSKRIVTGGGGRDKSVNLWDADSGRLLASFSGHQEDVEAVAFFPGGSRLISASEDRTIKVWDIAERHVLLTAIGFGDDGYVSFTPEGCYAGSSGIESRLSIFNGSRYEPMSLDARKAMQEPAGFTSLLTR
jgi:WD40 repeat protein